MTVFISATKKYTGVEPATRGVLNKLKNLYAGYYEVELNLNDFISYNRLSMILNNDIVRCESLYFELYNYDKLFNADLNYNKNELLDELKDPTNESNWLIGDLEDYGFNPDDIETLDEALNDYTHDHIYEFEVYQYFIVPEYEAINYWDKYTSYPIYHDEDADIYLVGITHWGMSWDYFSTSYKVRQYL